MNPALRVGNAVDFLSIARIRCVTIGHERATVCIRQGINDVLFASAFTEREHHFVIFAVHGPEVSVF